MSKLKVVLDVCKAHNNMVKKDLEEASKTKVLKWLNGKGRPQDYDVRACVYDDGSLVHISGHVTGDEFVSNPNTFDHLKEYSAKW